MQPQQVISSKKITQAPKYIEKTSLIRPSPAVSTVQPLHIQAGARARARARAARWWALLAVAAVALQQRWQE